MLHREREALRARTDALQMTLMQSQGREALVHESSPAAILKKVKGYQCEGGIRALGCSAPAAVDHHLCIGPPVPAHCCPWCCFHHGSVALHTHSLPSPARLLISPLQLEDLDALKGCVGWQLESAAEDPVSGEAVLRLADLFRLRLNISRDGASAAVEALPGAERWGAGIEGQDRAGGGLAVGQSRLQRSFSKPHSADVTVPHLPSACRGGMQGARRLPCPAGSPGRLPRG